MKILVTGANGYIGRHVVKKLCERAETVIACDLANTHIDSRASFVSTDILNHADDTGLFSEIGEPDVCIHLAWKDGFNHNADSHLELLPRHYLFIKNLIDAGVQSLSIMGSMHEIGYWKGRIDRNTPCNPMSMYGIAKNALRQAIMAYAKGKTVSVKWLRAYYITGDDAANHSIFAKILQACASGQAKFPFTSGENLYDFENISILASQISTASTQNKTDGIIECCSGKPTSLKEKVEQFIIENKLNISLEYGAFPDRPYDSPVIFGDSSLIDKIMEGQK